MDQTAPSAFIAPAIVARRPNRPLQIVSTLLTVLLIGLATFVWQKMRCKDCAPPIVCAKQCPSLDRQIEKMLRERQMLLQPKSTDRVEQE